MMATPPLRIGMYQGGSVDKAENLKMIEKLVVEHHAECDLLAFCELFIDGCKNRMKNETRRNSQRQQQHR
jgi:hypothetical protein